MKIYINTHPTTKNKNKYRKKSTFLRMKKEKES